ncbi:hypothetical protein I6U33_25660 [Pseudomonas carnis]|uniref:hypothetical protein n=1 Tax=Pseudomonas carnis TaxID=2487355 RepID=UPI001C6F743A|nr:hypothetical protein [Pseudomonas carnis]MBW9240721.1 hypothetical protein [Pseudomonas carnis]
MRNNLIDQLSWSYPLDQRRQVVILPFPPQITHEDSISTAPLHRVVDVHDRKLKCFNKIVHGHAAHVPFVWLSPHISTVRDHIQVGRVPKTAVGLLSKKLSYVVEKKIEPLVKVCPFETKPQFFGYVYRRPTADAWIKG